MSKICEICGKKPVAGRSIVRHGIPKKKGGIGLNITGINKRRFMPNLQNVHAVLPNGAKKHIRVCTRCIRSNKVVKA